MVSVLIIDDETLIRRSLAALLGQHPDVEICSATSGDLAVDAIKGLTPEVILVDERAIREYPAISAEIRNFLRRPALAVLTSSRSEGALPFALEVGATGFLLKDMNPLVLPHVIVALANGATVIDRGIASIRARANRESLNPYSPISTLNERERKVVQLLAEGATNQEIAKKLTVSLGTVKDDVAAILKKLGVRSRTVAVVVAFRDGLIQL